MKTALKTAAVAIALTTMSVAGYAADIKADIGGMAFKPGNITISVGDTITFTNRDGAPHTATAMDGSFTTKTLRRGESGTLAFNTAGTYEIFCKIHPGMRAVITVK